MIKAIIFDFDGVIAESVSIKTEAFAEMFKHCDQEVVGKVIEYHLAHSGVSRLEKFKYYYKEVLEEVLTDEGLRALCDKFSTLVVDKVVAAPWVNGAKEFLEENHSKYKMFIASGTPDPEIKEIVDRKGIGPFFEEVQGSPRLKKDITQDILERYELDRMEVLFVGDAPSDLTAAKESGVHFVGRIPVNGHNPFDKVDFDVIPDLTLLEQTILKIKAK